MTERFTHRTRTAWHGVRRVTAMAIVAAVAVTTLVACIPDSDPGDSTSSRFYKGAIPAPAPLAAFSSGPLPEMPEPPTDYTDDAAMEEYQRQVAEYMKLMEGFSGDMSSEDTMQFATEVTELAEVTRAGGENAVAAWQSLLVAAGIAVGLGDNAVEVSGMTGAGIPMPLEELRLQTALGTSHGRMHLTDFADMLDGAGIEGDVEELRESLAGATDYAFFTVFLALDPTGLTFTDQYYGEHRIKPTEDVTLSAAQVGLVLRRLAMELAVSSDEANPAASGAMTAPASGPAAIVTASAPMALGAVADICAVDDEWWETQIRTEIDSASGKIFPWLKNKAGLGGKLGSMRNAANAINAIAGLITKFFLLEADFSIGSEPLVRTKDHIPGERQELTVKLAYEESAYEDVKECVAQLYKRLGVDLDAARGPTKGVDVDLMLTGSRLQYARGSGGTEAYRQKADDNGTAVFALEGKKQPKGLPDGAEPEEVTSGIRVDANLKGSDLFADLLDAANAARGGVLGMVIGALERVKLLSFSWDVPVRDWTLEADFDMTLTGAISAHSAYNTFNPGLYGCPDSDTNRSTSALGQISGEPHRVTAEFLSGKDDGEALTALLIRTKGTDIADLKMHDNGTELAYVQFDYDLMKQENDPEIEPMPPLHRGAGSGCGDGNGSGSAPPAPDCGERSFLGLATVNMLSDFLYATVDQVAGNEWKRCGVTLHPTVDDIPSPPSNLDGCRGAYLDDGEIPNLDTVFSESNRFEISGELRCSSDGEGSLHRFTFDWTLEFCRIVEGKRAC